MIMIFLFVIGSKNTITKFEIWEGRAYGRQKSECTKFEKEWGVMGEREKWVPKLINLGL